MTGSIAIVRTVADLRAQISAWRKAGDAIGLVPTMGALHDGHLSLARKSLGKTTRTCVTLFVNPRQFAPTEDLAVYPRNEARDAALLAGVGAHLLFAPGVEEMYTPGNVTTVSVGGVGTGLEEDFRPGFFAGVATIVAKLLLQALPDVAFFGEKDYQQLQVIKRLVKDLDIPVEVEGGPTVREADGLAMSSRNAYLTPEERAIAPALYRTLTAVAGRFAGGEAAAGLEAWGRDQVLAAGFSDVNYLTIRDSETLKPAQSGRSCRVLAAARLGRARLIDNVAG